MEERHSNEQYFFDEATVEQLADVVQSFENPCCLCAPMLGKALVERGVSVHILDIDERFATLPGFRHYDISQPEWLGEPFGLILCDPPFFNVSLSQLFAAIRMLSRNDFRQPLMVSYLTRREASLLRAFSDFKLKPTGYLPRYQTVQASPKNEIAFYSNVEEALLRALKPK